MELSNKTKTVWDNADACDCDDQDCYQNHKLCGICKGTIIYGAHISNQPGSSFAWNLDHKIKYSEGGRNNINNLQAVHVTCNQNKN